MKEYMIQVGNTITPSGRDEREARLEARKLASANPGTEVLLWHSAGVFRNTDLCEPAWQVLLRQRGGHAYGWAKENIQRAGTVLEWDGDDGDYDEALNRWYAVQLGDSTDCGGGSEDYATALNIARSWAEQIPDEKVRIVHCTLRDDFADEVEIIQEGGRR